MSQAEPFPTTPAGWRKRVWNLAWPTILSGLTGPLVGMVDTAVVGQLPHPRYMAAVAVGAVIFSSVFWVFGFLRMGTTGFVAQAFGRGDGGELGLAILRPLFVALLLGMIMIGLQYPLSWLAFKLMAAEADVTRVAGEYFAIRIWSAPATFINYCVLGALFGMQKMRLALLTQVVLNGSNMLLDFLFVLGLGWDVSGVALATLLSEYLAAGLGLWLLRASWLPLFTLRKKQFKSLLDQVALRAMFEVNGNLFMRTLFLTAAFFFFTAQGAQFGTVVLAANAVLINMLYMLAYGLDGFAHAAEALVGSAYGRRDREAFRAAVKSSMLWAAAVAVFISLLYLFFGIYIIRLMTAITEVIDTAWRYLPWLVAAPLIAVWSFQFDGIFVGMTQTRIMRNTVGFALLVYVVLVLLLTPLWGNHALWACLMLFLLLRGLGLALYYPFLLRQFAPD